MSSFCRPNRFLGDFLSVLFRVFSNGHIELRRRIFVLNLNSNPCLRWKGLLQQQFYTVRIVICKCLAMRLLVVILNVLYVFCFIFTFVTFEHFNSIFGASMIIFLMLPHNNHLSRLEIANHARELLALHVRYRPVLCAVSLPSVEHHVAPLGGLIFTELALPDVVCRNGKFAVVQLLVSFKKFHRQSFVIARLAGQFEVIKFWLHFFDVI